MTETRGECWLSEPGQTEQSWQRSWRDQESRINRLTTALTAIARMDNKGTSFIARTALAAEGIVA